MHQLRRFLEATDAIIYRVERALLLVAVSMMTALVFADVVQRTFSRPVGKTAGLLLFGLELFSAPSPETVALVEGTVGPVVFWTLAVLMSVFGTHASRGFKAQREGSRAELPGLGRSVVIGIAIAVGMFAAIKGLLLVAPSGIAGAQKFALGFLVWAGFLGASLATRSHRHIALDAVKKKLGDDVLPWFSFFGAMLTSTFCFVLVYLSGFKLFTQITEWADSDGAIHVFESLPIPEWVVTAAIPVSFFLVGARFLAQGASDLLFGPSLIRGADSHGVDLDALADEEPLPPAGPPVQKVGLVLGRPRGGAR